MLDAQDLELRRTMITATDARAIVGVCPHRTAYDVYMDKLGLTPEPTEEQKKRFRMGHLIEDALMVYAAEETGYDFRKVKTMRHASLEWVGASPDRLVYKSAADETPFAVAEGKNVSLHMLADWREEDELPEYVHVQGQWQMPVVGVSECIVPVLVAGEPRMLHVEHSDDLSSALLEACEAFWKRHILAKVPPSPDGSEKANRMVRQLFPRSRVEMLEATPEADAMARHYLELCRTEDALSKEAARLKQELQLLIGEAEGLEGEGWRITYKNNKSGGPDWKAIAEALNPAPELIAQHTRDGARVFRCTEVKAKAPARKRAA
jgi:putative phage-type endonuclease